MKRFTETLKWDDPWFRTLAPELKCFWWYLVDKCDHAGVWEVDFAAASFFVGADLGEAKVSKAFVDRIETLPDGHGSKRWRVLKFVQFQYPTLSRDCKPHGPVFAAIEKHGLQVDAVKNGLRCYPINGKASKALHLGFESLQEEETEKDQEAVTENEPEKDQVSKPRNPLLDALVQHAELTNPLNAQKSLWPKCATALKRIGETTPAEIARRAENYRSHFRDAAISSTALANHWGRCDKPANGGVNGKVSSFA